MRAVLFFILFLSAVGSSVGQNTPPAQSNDLDKLYTPDKNSIFNNKGGSDGKSREGNELNIKNVVKFNMGLLVRNTAGFYWERKIADKITIQPGIGMCYGKDKLMTFLGGEANMTPSLSSSNTVPFGELLQQGYFRDMNLFSSFAFRFYSANYYNSDETFQSGYLELNVRYSAMNLNYRSETYNQNSYGYYNGSSYFMPNSSTASFHTFSFYSIYGYQTCTTGRIKTTHDFYIGAGIRSTSYSSYTLNEKYPVLDQYGQVVYVSAYVKSGHRESALIPSFVAGYVFGFGF